MARIYKGKPAEVTYKGSAASIKFNPQQAANDERRIKQYKNAILQDGKAMAADLQREQARENAQIQAQQQADRGQMAVEQNVEQDDLARTQLFDQQILKQDQFHQQGLMSLESSYLTAKHSVSNARRQVIGNAIQGMLSFAGSYLQYDQQIQAAEEAELEKKQREQRIAALNKAGLGNLFSTPSAPDQSEVSTLPLDPTAPEPKAQTQPWQEGMKAEVVELGKIAQETRQEGSAFSSYQAEQIESLALWNQLPDGRGDVLAGKMMLKPLLEEAAARGLIRPGAQGMQDIQNIMGKFADKTGLTQMALSDPEFVANNFSQYAVDVATGILNSIATKAATEIAAARTAKADQNIATAFAGLSVHSAPAQYGQAFDTANTENTLSNFGGIQGRTSTYSTLVKVSKELVEKGDAAGLAKLKGHAPNPDTPNITLGSEFGSYIDKQILAAQDKQRTIFRNDKTDRNIKAEQAYERYWAAEERTPQMLQQLEATLRSLNTRESVRLADSLVKHGYNYSKDVEIDLLRRFGTANEPSLSDLRNFNSQGIISDEFFRNYSKRLPDAQSKKKIDEGIEFYKPSRIIQESIVDSDGKPFGDLSLNLPAETKTKIRQIGKRFDIELGRRLAPILRTNPDLEIESEEFEKIVNREAAYLMKNPKYQITFTGNQTYKFGEDESYGPILDKFTVSPGVQNVTGLTAQDAIVKGGISAAQFDPVVDHIIAESLVVSDSRKTLSGEQVSQRTRDWAKSLGMTPRDFIEGQRYLYGLPPLSRIDPSEVQSVVPESGNILDAKQGTKVLMSLGLPLRGAAYLSSAIKHESSWDGNRKKWRVNVPGDDSTSNGGLLSWAAFPGNPARLGRIEAYFGKPINEVSEIEQLKYILHELKTSYNPQYLVFTNENANPLDLQAATWEYIKWNRKYTGDRWKDADALIRWGSTNL
jgi:hypothetical protein